jgi:hypothetical protein
MRAGENRLAIEGTFVCGSEGEGLSLLFSPAAIRVHCAPPLNLVDSGREEIADEDRSVRRRGLDDDSWSR